MLTVIVQVDAPSWLAQGVKEHIAMCLEPFDDVRVVEVRNSEPEPLNEQLKIEGGP